MSFSLLFVLRDLEFYTSGTHSELTPLETSRAQITTRLSNFQHYQTKSEGHNWVSNSPCG